jgi:zinc protease
MMTDFWRRRGRRKGLGWIGACCLAMAMGLAVAGSAAGSESPWPHQESDLTPDPALIFGRLDNGLRYVLRVNDTPRDRISMHLNVQAGSLHESEDQRGLAHFLEHMLFNGSTHFPPGELVKYFQRIGMDFGDDANAHTGFHETVYDVLLPDNRPESIAEGLLVLHDYASGALLLDEEINREREVVLAEMRSRDSPGYRTFEATLGFEYEGLRIAERLPIGKEDVVRRAGRASLKKFYDDWYRPDRMVVVMVGDFDPAAAEGMIRERFAGLKNRGAEPGDPPMGDSIHRGTKTFYHHEPELGHANVSIGQVRTVPFTPDSIAFQRQQLAEQIALRILDHRLESRLERPDAPFTHVSAGAGIFLKTLRSAELQARMRNSGWAEALKSLEHSLRQALVHGFDAAEVERVRSEMKAELERAAAQAGTRQSPALAGEIIGDLNAGRVTMAPDQQLALLGPMIDAFSPAQIHDALRQAWGDDHWLVMVTGNENLSGGDAAPEARILRAYDASRSEAVQPWEASAAVGFPYLPPPEAPARVVERIVREDLGVVQARFANGVALSVKKTDFKDDEVLLSVDLEPGRSGEPADRPGLAELAEAMMNADGLGALSRDDLERALAGRNLSLSARMGEDRLRLMGETVPGEVSLLFDLVRHHLLDPGWRPSVFTLVMDRYQDEYANLERSVEGQMSLKGRRFLAGGDGRFGLPPREAFEKLTLDDVTRWIGPILAGGALSISVVGDVDPEEIISLAGRYLGTLPERKPPTLAARPGPRFPGGERMDIGVDTQLEKAMVVVSHATEDMWDIHRTRRLNLLAEVVSDRLREQVRERLGASYSPFAYHWPSRAYPGYGVMSAVVQVDPGQIDIVEKEIERILADLASNGVGADEFARIREPALTGIKDLKRENAYWRDSVLAGAWRHPEQLDWSRDIYPDHAAVTAGELSGLAARYLTPERRATIVIRPREEEKSNQ